MHISRRLPSVLAIAASCFVSDALAGTQAKYHNGAAIMHDPNYTDCINPSGPYHKPPAGALAEIGPCYSPPYGPGVWSWYDGATVVTAPTADNKLCLDVGDDPQEGNQATLETCRPGAAGQQWIYKPDTNVFVVAGYDLCLDLPNNDVTPGTQLDIVKCDEEDPAQYWQAHDFSGN